VLYYLIHSDTRPQFKEALKNKDLEILRFNPFYSVVFPIELIEIDLREDVGKDSHVVYLEDL